MISENDGSGEEGHFGVDGTGDVFVYDGVGVGDGLDDLDGTTQEAEEHWQRYQAQFRAFNAPEPFQNIISVDQLQFHYPRYHIFLLHKVTDMF